MNSSSRYGFSIGIRLFVCSLAIFFTFLAVLDRFEKRSDIVYSGEFFSETDFKFIELPNILQYPSGNKISSTERIELFTPFQILLEDGLEALKIEINSVFKVAHLFFPIGNLFKYSLNTNAP
jgi:hypothetical protein